MLNKLKNRKQGGFTIIETLIVLAIAGLILVVVLLAVPGLKRNGRNTTLKDDVNTVAGGISTYESDNGGTPPVTIASDGSGTVTLKSASDTTGETVKVQGGTTVEVTDAGNAPGTSITTVDATKKTAIGTVDVVIKKDCDGNASARAFQLWYVVETSNGTTQNCVTG